MRCSGCRFIENKLIAEGERVDYYADGETKPQSAVIVKSYCDELGTVDIAREYGGEPLAERVRYSKNGLDDNLHHHWEWPT